MAPNVAPPPAGCATCVHQLPWQHPRTRPGGITCLASLAGRKERGEEGERGGGRERRERGGGRERRKERGEEGERGGERESIILYSDLAS